MERVTFLIEDMGLRISCLLNPESLTMQRSAGVQPRRSISGPLSGAGQTDDPLLFTGGGRTELDFQMLFDINVAGSTIQTEDVRDLTGPFWRLAENATNAGQLRVRLPQVRFIWGKIWNVLGVVVSVAERFENFTAEGVPTRSWLHMRFIRVPDRPEPADTPSPFSATESLNLPLEADFPGAGSPLDLLDDADLLLHEPLHGGDRNGAQITEPLYETSAQFYGDPSQWRLIAWYNDIIDPLHLPEGLVLRIPPLSAWRRLW
jgi:hypothetical protein